jgi:hypothetical protein
MIDIKAIEERCERATKGPWDKRVAGVEGDNYIAGTGPWYRVQGSWNANNDNSINDADFIAYSRQDIPALLEAVKEARFIIRSALKLKWSCWPISAGLPCECAHCKAEAWLAKMGGE